MTKSDENSTGNAGPSFEDALKELQQIVADLEEGTLGLEESMQRFEKGVGLLRRCHQTLERAEQKIQILTSMDPNVGPITAPFDATSTIEQSQSTPGMRRGKKARNDNETIDPVPDEEEDDTGGMLFK